MTPGESLETRARAREWAESDDEEDFVMLVEEEEEDSAVQDSEAAEDGGCGSTDCSSTQLEAPAPAPAVRRVCLAGDAGPISPSNLGARHDGFWALQSMCLHSGEQ